MKFRKKPVVIDAVRWDGSEKCLNEVIFPFIGDFAELPDDNLHVHKGIGYTPAQGELDIPTLEGTMTAKPGDWIIRGVKGEFYPCKADIFAATYEPAHEEGPKP